MGTEPDEELKTVSFPEASKLSKGLRIFEKEADLEKNPAGRASMEWEVEVNGARTQSEGRRMWKGMEGRQKGSCWIVSESNGAFGGSEGTVFDFEGLILVVGLLETIRGGCGCGGGGGGLACLGGVVET